MGRFAYLREFVTKDGFDFSTLSLQQRLFMSAVLTKYRYGDRRTLAEIIFNDERVYSKPSAFIDYDNLITSVIEDELGAMTDYIKKNASRLDEERKSDKAEDRYYIKAINIETSKIHTLKHTGGRVGEAEARAGERPGISQLSWKAFAVAASLSKIGVTQWRMLPIYNWLTAYVTSEKLAKTNKTVLKRNIEKWLKVAEISGEFDKDVFIVDTKDYQTSYKKLYNGAYIRGASKKRNEMLDRMMKTKED